MFAYTLLYNIIHSVAKVCLYAFGLIRDHIFQFYTHVEQVFLYMFIHHCTGLAT